MAKATGLSSKIMLILRNHEEIKIIQGLKEILTFFFTPSVWNIFSGFF